MRKLSISDKEALECINVQKDNSLSPYACKNADFIRKYPSKYNNDVLRTQYSIDIDNIIHSPFYNRGSDKTQVFSFYKNDDITRRAAHVQLVSRIGRVIGRALDLNLDLIEAIAIGHDIGHTPFGHKGEEFLSELYHNHTDRFFNHNVHSVRVLKTLSQCNLTVQTLDGILCHCGEKVFDKYEPAPKISFEEFESVLEECYTQEGRVHKLRPSTMEGCVMRISDMIAYAGKDRQDATYKAKLKDIPDYCDSVIGKTNSEIIQNTVEDIIANSLGKPYIAMSSDVFKALKDIVTENGRLIYQNKAVTEQYFSIIQPMMNLLYERFLYEYENDMYNSLIYKHHIKGTRGYWKNNKFIKNNFSSNDIVVDFIASMTDDYFVDVFKRLYEKHELSSKLEYVDYFDERYM